MRHVHLIGIGGSGLSAIARVLLERGEHVSGSDRTLSPLAASLQEAGAVVYTGHHAGNVTGADLVIRSSAIPEDNVEVIAAREIGIPVLKRADFLGELMSGQMGIAVAGTHGKTTTTAMIAWMLTALGQDPTFIIGGVARNLGVNARAGKGKTFVIEADEYDHMFLGLKMQIAVVTHIEHDHPDCYPTPKEYYQAFRDFCGRLPGDGRLVACVNDAGAAQLLQEYAAQGGKALGYGIAMKNRQLDLALQACWVYRASDLAVNDSGGFSCTVIRQPKSRLMGKNQETLKLTLQIPGEHNVENALAALAVADEVSLPLKQATQALAEFNGTGRRFELVGEAVGVIVVDDYAHHPTEIRATLQAARTRYARCGLWVVWQPHTYSRTRALYDQFLTAFTQADHVIVTEIYAAREQNIGDFSAQQLVTAMRHSDVRFIPNLKQVTEYLLEHLQANDVLLVLSAGDADQISAAVYRNLQERNWHGN